MPNPKEFRRLVEEWFRGVPTILDDDGDVETPPDPGLAVTLGYIKPTDENANAPGDENKNGMERILLENKKEKSPEPPRPWARLFIRTYEREQKTIGSEPLFQTTGSVFIEVRTEAGAKEREKFDELAKNLADIFASDALKDAGDFSDVEFHTSTQREVGADGKWFLVIVEVPFSYYDRA